MQKRSALLSVASGTVLAPLSITKCRGWFVAASLAVASLTSLFVAQIHPARAYSILVAQPPNTNIYKYTLSAGAGETIKDFHIPIPTAADPYFSPDAPETREWVFQRNNTGLHWSTAGTGIGANTALDFYLGITGEQLGKFVQTDAYLTNNGNPAFIAGTQVFSQVVAVPVNLSLIENGQGLSTTTTTINTLGPAGGRLVTTGVILYKDSQGTLKQGRNIVDAIVTQDPVDQKFDTTWVLSNTTVAGGGIEPGEIQAMDITCAGLPKCYPRDFGREVTPDGAAARVARDDLNAGPAAPGGFNDLLGTALGTADPLRAGQTATVQMLNNPNGYLVGTYNLKWNPDQDPGPDVRFAPVPEPPSLVLFAIGLIAIGCLAKNPKRPSSDLAMAAETPAPRRDVK